MDSECEPCSDESTETSEPKHPSHTVVVGRASGLLKELEDDGAEKRSDDLGSSDGDVVNTQNDTSLIGALFGSIVLAISNTIRLTVRRIGAEEAATHGVTLGDFR